MPGTPILYRYQHVAEFVDARARSLNAIVREEEVLRTTHVVALRCDSTGHDGTQFLLCTQ
jgi:hypothetical protein